MFFIDLFNIYIRCYASQGEPMVLLLIYTPSIFILEKDVYYLCCYGAVNLWFIGFVYCIVLNFSQMCVTFSVPDSSYIMKALT